MTVGRRLHHLREIERHRRNAELMLGITMELDGDAKLAFQLAMKELTAARDILFELIRVDSLKLEGTKPNQTNEVSSLPKYRKLLGRYHRVADSAVQRQDDWIKRAI